MAGPSGLPLERAEAEQAIFVDNARRVLGVDVAAS
jgi:hypothetical protein